MTHRILAGVTNNNELYFLEIDATNNRRNGYDEFTMSGFTVTPISAEEIEERNETYLEDEGEYFWREAVAAKNTIYGLEDWLEMVREEADSVDTSLFDQVVTVDGTEYSFESQSCGQHRVETLKHYFIPKAQYRAIMNLWDTYHMKKTPRSGLACAVMGNAIATASAQDVIALAAEAVTLIKTH